MPAGENVDERTPAAPLFPATHWSVVLTESALKSALFRLRARYREILREEVAQTVTGPRDVDDEIRYLLKVVSS